MKPVPSLTTLPPLLFHLLRRRAYNTASTSLMVPQTTHLHPGTPVNIILKADQRTGKLTPGHIADILTRGNHPHGIKVRLRDGQVGRVQSLGLMEGGEGGDGGVVNSSPLDVGVDEELAFARGEDAQDDDGVKKGRGGKFAGDDGYSGRGRGRRGSGSGSGSGSGATVWRGGKIQDDVRNDPVPVEEKGLDAYIIKAPSRNQAKKMMKKAGVTTPPAVGWRRSVEAFASRLNEEESQELDIRRGGEAGLVSKGNDAAADNNDGGKTTTQTRLEDEFPKLDSALIAAIIADYQGVEGAREVLKGLSR